VANFWGFDKRPLELLFFFDKAENNIIFCRILLSGTVESVAAERKPPLHWAAFKGARRGGWRRGELRAAAAL
jgi:hypothetical protein